MSTAGNKDKYDIGKVAIDVAIFVQLFPGATRIFLAELTHVVKDMSKNLDDNFKLIMGEVAANDTSTNPKTD